MKHEFLNVFLDPKSLLTQTKNNINPFLFENNTSQIEKIYEFYKSDSSILYVNGFLGTGKVGIINYTLDFLTPNAIILKYNCFNSTILDDILLAFFKEFKNLASQNIISEPKIRTENFNQKVNSYFSQIEKPFLIIFDSFEAILEENRAEIIDFITHLKSMKKIKIIIIGRSFDSKNFKNLDVERVTTYALDKPIFEKYLKDAKIKAPAAIYDEFYKHTRGYYFFTAFAIKLMESQNLTLVEFLTKLKGSYQGFHVFLANQVLNLIQPNERNLFWFLSIIRHPVTIELLEKLDLYDEEKINLLANYLVIVKEGESLYIQDYIKDEIDITPYSHVLTKIHQFIVDLYSSQLPLKPLERDICISRQTMRKEIEFHRLFLPKKLKIEEKPFSDVNYLSYSKTLLIDEKSKVEEQNKQEEEKKPQQPSIDVTQRKNASLNLDNLIFHTKELPTNSSPQTEEQPQNYGFKQLVELMLQADGNYQFSEVIDLAQKALLMTGESDYDKTLHTIYKNLAFAYQQIGEPEKALSYYDLILKIYEKEQNTKKVNVIKFNIAKIYYKTYKIDKAKLLLQDITTSKDSPKSLVVKAYILLANIEEDSSTPQKAYSYYKLALDNSDEMMDIETLSELYFKYALVMDDKNDIENALEYYNKCINLGGNQKNNTFLSATFSNIAALYLEKNDTVNAIENYKKSYQIDKENNNFEGVYYSATKIAAVLQKNDTNEALKYFNLALDYAKKTKDIFYIISASLAIGDFQYDQKQDEIALKYYLNALESAQNNLSKDNIYKINVRINDLKFRLGVEKFENLVELIKKQGE